MTHGIYVKYFMIVFGVPSSCFPEPCHHAKLFVPINTNSAVTVVKQGDKYSVCFNVEYCTSHRVAG